MTATTTNVWSELERRRRRTWQTLALGVIPALSFLTLPVAVAATLLLVWAVALVVISEQSTSYPCPRCTKPLFRDGLFHNSFSKTCLHCDQVVGGEVTSAARRS